MATSHLHSARRVKNDEFYTRTADIKKEMQHHSEAFRGKTIYCNCDDFRISNFVKYFRENFVQLGLKKLIATCYIGSESDLFEDKEFERAPYFEFDGRVTTGQLVGNGDFRSAECTNILKSADVVVTNPPFSLFSDHLIQGLSCGKDVLTIGTANATSSRSGVHR